MFETLLRKLTIWRNETARQEGVELFRVLSNGTLEEIARQRPFDKATLTAIKGIKEAKYHKYGTQLLKLVADDEANPVRLVKSEAADLGYFRKLKVAKTIDAGAPEKIYSVSEFWDAVNEKVAVLRARIRGEVSSVDMRQTAVYFSIKDERDESVMNCFIFRYQYDILAIPLEEGMKVVVEGYPEIYKPYGRLSLRTTSIEPEGEGELKKQYERLRRKLEEDGLFAPEGKRELGRLPRTIGLITSREGAAIGDFRSNIGRYGFRIKFVNSSVEGRKAVFELIDAFRTMKRQKGLDAVVVIRGGGSLESLQAFNNEALVRAARTLEVPLICGVGHDRDISLLSLAADYAVSTPTAAARLLGSCWERELEKIDAYERNMIGAFREAVDRKSYRVRERAVRIEHGFGRVLDRIEEKFECFGDKALRGFEERMDDARRGMLEVEEGMGRKMEASIKTTELALVNAENIIRLNDPVRQLRLGYGIIAKAGISVRSVEELRAGEDVSIRLYDGTAEASLKKIKKLKR